MHFLNPYSFTFYLTLAATVVAGALEAWGALVQGHGFDPSLTLSMSVMLMPFYVMKKRADQSNESSSCKRESAAQPSTAADDGLRPDSGDSASAARFVTFRRPSRQGSIVMCK